MARLRGTNVLNHCVRSHQADDGYVAVGSDGYTVVNSIGLDSVVSSFKRTGTGLWSCTLKEANACNLNYFDVVSQLHTGDSPSVVFFQLLSDNVGVVGTTADIPGGTPQVIHFKFCNSSGTAEDLPANAGFKYEIGLQVGTAYQIVSY